MRYDPAVGGLFSLVHPTNCDVRTFNDRFEWLLQIESNCAFEHRTDLNPQASKWCWRAVRQLDLHINAIVATSYLRGDLDAIGELASD